MKIAQQEAVNAARTGQVTGVNPVSPNIAGDAQGTGTTDTESSAATVSFSPQAQEIAKYQAVVNSTPDVREELVQSLKAKIENGEYNVSGADIAEMMLRRHAADNSANG